MKITPSERYEERVSRAIVKLDELLAQHRWEDAAAEVADIKRRFPDSNQLIGLPNQVKMAWRQQKEALDRKFRQAARRDDPQKAMDLLRELDRYLTPQEAPAYAEIARSVIDRLKENLGLRFRMAAAESDWVAATKAGEQIMREFPNTQMAHEVRSNIDLLRERALGQRHEEIAEQEQQAKQSKAEQTNADQPQPPAP